ncbi:MAG: beta-exotoxin transport system permease protein [Patescibacteria group bacterium]|nr:ABC transporter permease subunit [Candidatus Saccharibacteria bacterium]MDQ5963328.1 beta-exotoxin transport system permease protein [Patescibacteria group bacterium]
MRHVLFWELKRRRTALLWWTIGSIVMTVVILALYPSIRDQAAQMNQVINQLPEGLREMKAGSAGSVDVGDPLEFLNSQLFYATLPIMWIILAITRGGSILGREEQDKTLEVLLAQPITRSRLVTAKALALACESFIVGGATLIVILALSPVFDLHISSIRLIAATAYTSLFCLSFGYIAYCLQAASSLTRKGAVALATVLGFGGYILTSLSGLTDWLDMPVKAFPYHYFKPLDALQGHVPKGLLLYLCLAFIFGTLIAIVGFRKRDID